MTVDPGLLLPHLMTNSLWVGALILLVLVLRRPVATYFGPRAAYALWALPVLRLILPQVPLPHFSKPAMTPPPAEPLVELMAAPMPRGLVYVDATPTADPVVVDTGLTAFVSSLNWADFILPVAAIWFAGVVATLMWLTVAHFRFSDCARRNTVLPSPGIQTLADSIIRDMGIKVPVSIRQCPRNDGPLVCGLFHPIVVLPEDFHERFTIEEQRYALTHELMHVRRGDLWVVLAMMALRASQWWNPLAARAIDSFRADQEAACDAAVLRYTAAGRHEYACTLMKSIRRTPTTAAALTLDHGLKERLTTMKSKHALKGGSALTAAIIALGLGATASYAVMEPNAQPEPQPPQRAETPETPAEPEALEFEELDTVLSGDDVARELRWVSKQEFEEGDIEEMEAELEAMAEELERQAEELDELADDLEDASEEGDKERIREIHRQMREKQAAMRKDARVIRLKGNDLREQARIVREVHREAAKNEKHRMKMAFAGDGDFKFDQDGSAFAVVSGGKGKHFSHDGEGIVLLTDPMDGVEMNLAALENIGDIDVDFDMDEFEMPMMTIVEVRTKDGEMVEIPEMTLPRPGSEKKIEEMSKRIEARVAKMDIEGKVQAALGEDFSKKVQASTDTIVALAESCEKYRERNDKPKIMTKKNPASGKDHKLLCYTGGKEALKSEKLANFVEGNRNLTDEEKARFKEAAEGKRYSFQFSFDNN